MLLTIKGLLERLIIKEDVFMARYDYLKRRYDDLLEELREEGMKEIRRKIIQALLINSAAPTVANNSTGKLKNIVHL